MDTDIRLNPNLPAIECTATANQLVFNANISLEFHLCNETPGYSNLEVWFEEKPTLQIKLLPLGLPMTDISLVSNWLNESLENVIESAMVGSQRVLVDMADMYYRTRLTQEKTLIRIVVHKPLLARNENLEVQRYVKLQCGHIFKRTYVYDEEQNSTWTCLLDFPMKDLPNTRNHLLKVTIQEFFADRVEPEVIASGIVCRILHCISVHVLNVLL